MVAIEVPRFPSLMKCLVCFRLNTIKKCAAVSKNQGYTIFALINNGECLATKHKDHVYKRFGRSTKCRNGEGGVGAMNVYELTGKIWQVYESNKFYSVVNTEL